MALSLGGVADKVITAPNVVPMIDVMLVLLIIFMIVTPVIAGGFQATMPEAKNIESRPKAEGDIILGIDLDGSYYLDNGSGETARIPNDSLPSYLMQIYAERTRDKIMFFRADQNLEYGLLEDAMEHARAAGVRVLAAISKSPTTGGGR